MLLSVSSKLAIGKIYVSVYCCPFDKVTDIGIQQTSYRQGQGLLIGLTSISSTGTIIRCGGVKKWFMKRKHFFFVKKVLHKCGCFRNEKWIG